MSAKHADHAKWRSRTIPFRVIRVFRGLTSCVTHAYPRSDDFPGSVVWGSWKNNFAGATRRALAYDGTSGAVGNVSVVRNILNQGSSYHLKLRFPDSGAFFLQKNIYTNAVSNVDPFLDAVASPVHTMR